MRQQAAGACSIFSGCTGTLPCGAAGLLKGCWATTTHCASLHLLPFFGAIPVSERVVVDGTWVFAAGVRAGIDGALHLAAELGGDEAAQAVQLHMVIWCMRRSRPWTATRPRWRQPRYCNRRGNPCAPSQRGGTRRHDVRPPNSASPFRPRAGNDLVSARPFGENRGHIGAPANDRAPK